MAEKFNVLKEKISGDKNIFGIERSTFILDEDGKIEKEWRDIDIQGHVEEILKYLNK